MSENTQTQFRTEGQPLFERESTENDNSAESSTVEKTNETDQTQSQDGEQSSADAQQGQKDGGAAKDMNLNDHPRWKEREDDWTKRFNEQEERHLQEIQKIREEIMSSKNAQHSQGTNGESTEIPPWFNGDEKQWAEFQSWNEGLITKAQERALNAIKAKSEEEQRAIDEATQFFNNEVAAIESDKDLNPQGMQIDRNKLLKTAIDNDLVDSKGRWNYKAAFRLMKPAEVFQAKKALEEKKHIASATMSDNRAETKASREKTSQDFKGKNWGDL